MSKINFKLQVKWLEIEVWGLREILHHRGIPHKLTLNFPSETMVFGFA